MTIPKITHEIRLAKYLEGEFTLENLTIASVSIRQPKEDEVVVHTDYVGLAAPLLYLMQPHNELGMPSWKIGDCVGAATIGTVVHSKNPELTEGDLVLSMNGWREYTTAPANTFFKLDPNLFPNPAYYLNQGATAYYGIAKVANVGKDDVVFVSGAAGGVGSLTGQIAKLLGAKKVIGSAGSKKKIDYLINELGYDASFDYHDRSITDQLKKLAPEGITVFFDTIGGEQLQAAIHAATPKARLVLCGKISVLVGNNEETFSREDLIAVSTKKLSLLPFGGEQYDPSLQAEWVGHFSTWLKEKRFVYPHTIVKTNIKKTPQAFGDFLKGKYQGNVVLQLEH